VSSIFSILIIVITFGVVTFYLLIERPGLHKYLIWFLGQTRDEKKAEHFVNSLENQIGGWVRGEALLMLIIGTLTYICLVILQVPHALPLAILAGLLEILPNIGPTIAAVPALIIAYTNGSFLLTAIVGIVYILIQQLENNFIVPAVMKRAAGLNPLVTILMMIIGLRLGGVLGALIAVPAFLFVKVLATEIYKLRLPGQSSN
jgi:predicted PurR-regulated permease PerM